MVYNNSAKPIVVHNNSVKSVAIHNNSVKPYFSIDLPEKI